MKRNYFHGLVAVGCGLAASFGAAVMVQGCSNGGDDSNAGAQTTNDGGVIITDSGSKLDATTTNDAGVTVIVSDASACPSTQALCGASCATLSRDPQNCGECGTTCGAGEACSAGKCATTCGGEQTFCAPGDAGDAGSPYCATLASDNDNCGSCGHLCGAGEMCNNGSCETSCGAEQTICNAPSDAGSSDGGAPYCATLASDNDNCGTCGNPCAAGESCSGGQCNVTCGASETLCSADGGASNGVDGGAAFCANFATDNANCGGCGLACGAGQMCSNGSCGTTCESDLLQCGTKCIDPSSSITNCGATAACDADAGTSGVACNATTQACSGGVCKPLDIPTFVASFAVDDGPRFYTNPTAYSCVAACALLNGGNASDYGCSTVAGSLNHLAWGSVYGIDEQHCSPQTPVDDNYSNGATYEYGVFSAYVSDYCSAASVNYCWNVPAN